MKTPLTPVMPNLGNVDPRKAMLHKMREKLAGQSELQARLEERRLEAQRKQTWAWGWKIAALVFFCLLSWAGYAFKDEIIPANLQHRPLRVLTAPKVKLSASQELLFWTYALYDADKLRKEFKLPPVFLINTGIAKQKIDALSPKADARSLFVLRVYQSNRGKIQ